jgi:hypothetical protein
MRAYSDNGLFFRTLGSHVITTEVEGESVETVIYDSLNDGEVMLSEDATEQAKTDAFPGYPAALTAQNREPFIAQAQAALDKSDVSIVRIVGAGVAVPADFLTHRSALRAIVNGMDTTSTTLPVPPTDFPPGT